MPSLECCRHGVAEAALLSASLVVGAVVVIYNGVVVPAGVVVGTGPLCCHCVLPLTEFTVSDAVVCLCCYCCC